VCRSSDLTLEADPNLNLIFSDLDHPTSSLTPNTTVHGPQFVPTHLEHAHTQSVAWEASLDTFPHIIATTGYQS
jgi:hypothetical protein